MIYAEQNDGKSEEINAIGESQAEGRAVCLAKRFICLQSCLLSVAAAKKKAR